MFIHTHTPAPPDVLDDIRERIAIGVLTFVDELLDALAWKQLYEVGLPPFDEQTPPFANFLAFARTGDGLRIAGVVCSDYTHSDCTLIAAEFAALLEIVAERLGLKPDGVSLMAPNARAA